MSSDATDSGLIDPVYRTVTPGYGSRGDTEMDVIGWFVLLGIAVLLFPLLPIFLVLVIIGRIGRAVRSQIGGSS
jgi:hypothetical protein